jgi:hypothetical protein
LIVHALSSLFSTNSLIREPSFWEISIHRNGGHGNMSATVFGAQDALQKDFSEAVAAGNEQRLGHTASRYP